MIVLGKQVEYRVNAGGRNVNDVALDFYRRTDGAYKFKKSSNMVDVYMSVYYQRPAIRTPGGHIKPEDVYEMKLNVNFTTYSGKLRVNLIEIDPEEQTLGHFVIDMAKYSTIKELSVATLSKIWKILDKMFEDYEFIY